MYARYIPPKKPVAAPPAAPVSTASGNAPPSPAAQKRKIVFDDIEVASPLKPVLSSSREDGTPDRAAKRLKKESKVKIADIAVDDKVEKEKEKKENKENKREEETEKKEEKGKKDKKRKEEKVEDEEADETTKDEEEKKRRKRKRKSKKTKEEDGAADEDSSKPESEKREVEEKRPVDEDTVMTIPPPEKEKKRKRKRKSKSASKEDLEEEPKETPKDEEAPKEKTKKKKKEHKIETPQEEEQEELPVRFKALLEKKEKSLKKAREEAERVAVEAQQEGDDHDKEHPVAPTELHGLEPLPQPEPVAHGSTAKLAYDTLPSWLANPVRVAADTRAPFTQFGIDESVARVLHDERDWADAFAVQTAVLPLLLPPGAQQQPQERRRRGDLVISAATGSGKTLAYVMPVMRDLSRSMMTSANTARAAARLQAVIVVPTRELVQQVHDVCETCARAFSAGSGAGRRVRIGVAVGSQSFRREQVALVGQDHVYDPEGYRAEVRRRQRWPLGGDDDDNHEDNEEDEGINATLGPPDVSSLPDHVVRHVSNVDLLVTTPGRLVEHIQATRGFTLDFVRWLVVDEADKLLGQSYQQWLAVVLGQLEPAVGTAAARKKPELGAHDFADADESGVRKVVLSATMTRDLSLLNSLKLRRPRHVVLEGARTSEPSAGEAGEEGQQDTGAHAAEYVLPKTLRESAIKVRDESQKPLYLVDLLSNEELMRMEEAKEEMVKAKEAESDSDDDSSDSDSDSSDSSSSSSDGQHPFSTTALVFTRSNENALRLSRLLALLAPPLARLVGTLTSTTRTSERRKTLRAFAAGRLRILVATDLAARGIDLPHLDHVINYDMPPSVEFYVHRVGRTARAGRTGQAWTLFSKKEAGWFWPAVAGRGSSKKTTLSASPSTIRRSNKVAKVALDRVDDNDDDEDAEDVKDDEEHTGRRKRGQFSDARITAYEAALEQLGREAAESHRAR